MTKWVRVKGGSTYKVQPIYSPFLSIASLSLDVAPILDPICGHVEDGVGFIVLLQPSHMEEDVLSISDPVCANSFSLSEGMSKAIGNGIGQDGENLTDDLCKPFKLFTLCVLFKYGNYKSWSVCILALCERVVYGNSIPPCQTISFSYGRPSQC